MAGHVCLFEWPRLRAIIGEVRSRDKYDVCLRATLALRASHTSKSTLPEEFETLDRRGFGLTSLFVLWTSDPSLESRFGCLQELGGLLGNARLFVRQELDSWLRFVQRRFSRRRFDPRLREKWIA